MSLPECPENQVCVDGFCVPSQGYCVSDQDCAPGCCCINGECYEIEDREPFLEVECETLFEPSAHYVRWRIRGSVSYPSGIRILADPIKSLNSYDYVAMDIMDYGYPGTSSQSFNIKLDVDWFKAGDIIRLSSSPNEVFYSTRKEPFLEAPCSGKFEGGPRSLEYPDIIKAKPETWTWDKYWQILRAGGFLPTTKFKPIVINL